MKIDERAIYKHYENYKGGVNNLKVATVYRNGSIIAEGTSQISMEGAVSNLKRNLKRRYGKPCYQAV